MFTHLVGERAGELNDLLTHGGFRRSQSIAYRPACEGCRACVSVRVVAADFAPSRNMRRIAERNADMVGDMRSPAPTSEQYSVFRAYLDARHRDGGMADMTVLDYAMMIEDSHVDTRVDRISPARPRYGHQWARHRPDAGCRSHRRAQRRAIDGLFVFRSGRGRPLARHLHDPRSHRARKADGSALRLSRLLGARLAQDGLQRPLPAAGAPDAVRLEPGRNASCFSQKRCRKAA